MNDYLNIYKQMSTVDLLIKHERALQKLYTAYAEAFPGHADFWTKIAHDEDGHAIILERLNRKLRADKVSFDDNLIAGEQIAAAIRFAEDQTSLAAGKQLTNMQALQIAHGIEKHMVEANTFKAFGAEADEELQSTLQRLERHTIAHVARIEAEMETARKNSKSGFFTRLFHSGE